MTIVGAVTTRHVFFRAWCSCWLVLLMLCASPWSYAAHPWRVVVLPDADPAQTMYRDRDGRTYFPFEVVAPMVEVSGAPIYGWYSAYADYGLTAGSVLGFERELMNQTPSLWRKYQGAVLPVVAVLTLQALTIAALLWQRRRRRLAEDEAALRLEELARAARFASAGELSASIAHEVGQPLGAILSNADAASMMLENREPEIAELQLILADVRRDALRANQVVQRLRSLLQKQPVEFGPLDLNATINEALVLVEPEGRRRRITIESNLDAEGAQITGDRIQLQQVLLNLVVNGMDAMQDTEAPRRVLSISTRVAVGGFELRVADRGHGIPAHAKKKLFDSLYSTKPHGMGMGLSIVRTIVTSHGGRISVEARSGGGSVFSIWLPVAAEAFAQRTLRGFARGNAVHAAPEICRTTQGGHP